jgi:hypothetical protein
MTDLTSTPNVPPCPACTMSYREAKQRDDYELPEHTCGAPQIPHPLDRAPVQCAAPPGYFRGSSFMTPTVLAYYRLRSALGRVLYVELSVGQGFHGEGIYGVTVRRANGDRLTPDPSTMYGSRHDAMQAIRDLRDEATA